MCNNCNCDHYYQCSIVGFMPIGFCCSECVLYDEMHTCLTTKSKGSIKLESGETEEKEDIKLISTSIEGNLIKVIIKKMSKEVPILIDLAKH